MLFAQAFTFDSVKVRSTQLLLLFTPFSSLNTVSDVVVVVVLSVI